MFFKNRQIITKPFATEQGESKVYADRYRKPEIKIKKNNTVPVAFHNRY